MKSGLDIKWSYSYSTTESDTTWSHRMDHYSKIADTSVHWRQLILSICFVIVLTTCVCGMVKKGLSVDNQRVR